MIDWSKIENIPERHKVDAVFGNADSMPAYDDIPAEFKNWNRPTKWNKLQQQIFYRGGAGLQLLRREGLSDADYKKIIVFIQAINSSWSPKHEHKEAAVAYLFSLYFTDWSVEEAPRSEEAPR